MPLPALLACRYIDKKMRQITKIYEVFTFSELSEEAKEKAHTDYLKDLDYPFLEEEISEKCIELLQKEKISGDPKIGYSLSNCQGDGAMFSGEFTWKSYNVSIKHFGRYHHYNSKTISITKEKDDSNASEATYEVFNSKYLTICKELEKFGYKCIDNDREIDVFADTCEANEYNFLSNGKMVNY